MLRDIRLFCQAKYTTISSANDNIIGCPGSLNLNNLGNLLIKMLKLEASLQFLAADPPQSQI